MLELYPLRDASWKEGELCAREEYRLQRALEETETELLGSEESILWMTTFVESFARTRSHTCHSGMISKHTGFKGAQRFVHNCV